MEHFFLLKKRDHFLVTNNLKNIFFCVLQNDEAMQFCIKMRVS